MDAFQFVLSIVWTLILIGSLIYLYNRVEKLESYIDSLICKDDALDSNLDSLTERVADLEFWEDERYNREQHDEIAEMRGEEEIADELESTLSDDANLSINERILLREAEFDRRIEAMKSAHPATPLHPDVHNIPHRAVDLRDEQLPDVEETD
jgi:hypothetical protein